MQHIVVPVTELMTLMVEPGMARISSDSTHMMAIVDNELHVLVGDFTGIDTATDLDEIIKRNL